jgi:glyoxylase-like metal-dependent hydrolase (beta-lactamase superfamily II)
MLVSLGLPLRPAPWNAMEITLAPRKLSDGVYALVSSTADTKNPAGIPEGTTGGIIVGETGVLVIETMLNATLANQVLDNVKKLTDKPIRYVVNTVYHGDHYYGNFLFPSTATIIMHSESKRYVFPSGGSTLIAMVQTANFREGNDIAGRGRLYGTRPRAVLAERKMRSGVMMVLKIAR